MSIKGTEKIRNKISSLVRDTILQITLLSLLFSGISAFVIPNYNSYVSPSFMHRYSTVVFASTSSPSTIRTSPRITDSAVRELSTNGYVIVKDFVSKEVVEELRKDVQNLRSRQKFKIAKIGQDATNTLNTNIRVAETCFLGENKLQDVPNNMRNHLYLILEMLRKDLSGNELLSTKDSRGQILKNSPTLDSSLSEFLYAYYPSGGFYRRHMDAVQNSASILRTYSLLLYLNENWQESDGGYLRIHLDSGTDFLPKGEMPKYIDVKPEAGTLVLFKSDKIPHKVLDTVAERAALVGWYNRPFSSADIANVSSDDDKRRGLMLIVSAVMVTFGLMNLLNNSF